MQAEHLLDAILLAALHHQHHVEVDEVERPHQQQKHGHARQQVEVTQVALAAHEAGLLVEIGLVEVELLQREILVAYLLAGQADAVVGIPHGAVDTGLPVDGIQVHGGEHVQQFPRHPVPMFAEVVRDHQVEVEGGLAVGFADHAPHRQCLAGIFQRLSHGIRAAEEAAGAGLGQHGVRGGVQGRLAHPHGVAEEAEEGGIRH